MATVLKLLCVLAHPDDESLGNGGILAKYAAEGVETYLITATRGERGWQGIPEDNPGLDELGTIREAELRAGAQVLGIREVHLLDYVDGDLDQANPVEAIGKIVAHIRRIQPQVIVTFDPFGAYGHPDHIAICQFTTAAVMRAVDGSYADPQQLPPHRVSKLYSMAVNQHILELYFEAFGNIVMPVDRIDRTGVPWEDWAITTHPNCEEHWQTVWKAISCHRTQLPGYQKLSELPETFHRELWGHPTYYRVFSLVNGGRAVETDLFDGLR
jgi:LmbE family N-acetylglucosaminyl deacetylase